MNTIESQKDYLVKRTETFLNDLKKAKNPFEVEAIAYFLKVLSTATFEKMHTLNSEERKLV